MKSAVFVIVLAGCPTGGPSSPSPPSDDACALVDAMLAIDSRAYQDLYANKRCGLDVALHEPLVIDVAAYFAEIFDE